MTDKNNEVFYINHRGELLIWLVILLVIVILFTGINLFKKKSKNQYDIFMPDVDGLIVGSPVRTMGIEVGHITKIKPINDEVYIRFIITDKTITLPQGTVATVEFSGMAGSKSLELYLPDEKTYIDPSVPLLEVSPPKRLSDAAGLLNEMFKKIGNIIAVSSRFGNKISEIELPEQKGSITNTEKFLKYVNEEIDKSQERANNLWEKLNNGKRKQ